MGSSLAVLVLCNFFQCNCVRSEVKEDEQLCVEDDAMVVGQKQQQEEDEEDDF